MIFIDRRCGSNVAWCILLNNKLLGRPLVTTDVCCLRNLRSTTRCVCVYVEVGGHVFWHVFHREFHLCTYHGYDLLRLVPVKERKFLSCIAVLYGQIPYLRACATDRGTLLLTRQTSQRPNVLRIQLHLARRMADDFELQREFGRTWPGLHMGVEDRYHFKPSKPCCGGSTLHFLDFIAPIVAWKYAKRIENAAKRGVDMRQLFSILIFAVFLHT